MSHIFHRKKLDDLGAENLTKITTNVKKNFPGRAPVRSALPGRLFVIGGCIGRGRRLNLAHQWKSLNAIPLQVTELRTHERHWCGIFTTVPQLHTTAITRIYAEKKSPTQVYLHIANKDNLLFKHCITMLKVRFTIILVIVSLIVTGLPRRISSEITGIVDKK